jgi:uncharacterized membrane protein (DUF373 family)
MSPIKLIHQIERLIIFALSFMLLISVLLATIDLGHDIYLAILTPPFLLITTEELFAFFRHFLIVIIALELMKLLVLRLKDEAMNAEIVIEVTLIAICNEIITFDYHTADGLLLVGVSTLLAAISISYYLFRKSRVNDRLKTPKEFQSP